MSPDPEVDEFVKLWTLCKTFHTLPGPGGILDQDGYLMYGLLYMTHWVNERQRIEQERESKRRT